MAYRFLYYVCSLSNGCIQLKKNKIICESGIRWFSADFCYDNDNDAEF